MTLKRLRSLSATSLCLVLLATGASCSRDAEQPLRPNLILIIGDDLGWPYAGFMGDQIVETPHLDRLARGGTTFPHGFTTASWCRPALASLLTGLHPAQWRAKVRALKAAYVQRAPFTEIVDFVTLPQLLGAVGYSSFQGGKFWESSYDKAGFTNGMRDAATVHALGPGAGAKVLAGGRSLNLGRSTMQPLWDFLDRHRPRESGQPPPPFFVWFAPMLPHLPFDAPDEFLDRYRKLDLSQHATFYYANITRFDARVGELVAYLEAVGLRKNTLLVYLSDNGWEQDPQQKWTGVMGGSKGKFSMYELGFRTPIIFNLPGTVPAGQVRDELVSSVDLFPTLLDFAGGTTPANRPGVSLHPLLTRAGAFSRTTVIGSSAGRQLRPPDLFPARSGPVKLRKEKAYFLRNARWRYIWYQRPKHADRPEEQLFRIDEDPRETRDVAAANPERTAEFRKQIKIWYARTTGPFRP